VTIGAQDLERHRPALTGHCYRMLGSATDADDAVQETLIRAWRSLDRFEGRAALRTWLHRIATNVCLDAIDARAGRVRPFDDGPSGTTEDELLTRPRTHWLEPIADARLVRRVRGLARRRRRGQRRPGLRAVQTRRRGAVGARHARAARRGDRDPHVFPRRRAHLPGLRPPAPLARLSPLPRKNAAHR
jgi:RNA polymerase sigma factor (sigma-70 family)